MFDFGDEDAEEPPEGRDEAADAEAARRAAFDLRNDEWKVRYSACFALSNLGQAAAPHLVALENAAECEHDDDVRKAARHAVRKLRDAGVQPPAAAASAPAAATGRLPGGGAEKETRTAASSSSGQAGRGLSSLKEKSFDIDVDGNTWAGPRAKFRIGKEEFTMNLERDSMTVADIVEVWEKQWGVTYASRIKFEAPRDSGEKWLRKDDAVPRTPFVVRLEAGSGSILDALSRAMRQYGSKTAEEVAAERDRKLLLQQQAAQRRTQADIKEDKRYMGLDRRQMWKDAEEAMGRHRDLAILRGVQNT